MNGEIYLSCALCVALKSALRGNPKPLPQDQKYIKFLNFEFVKEHFRTAEGSSRAAQDGVNDASKAAEQKDAYGSVQGSATDEARESGEAVKQKRTNRKEAANEKAASKKGADESTGSSFLQKARKFFTEQVAQKGREDEPISARRRWIEQCLKLGLKDAGLSIPTFAKDRALLGFSGMNVNGIVCRFEDFDSVFTPDWKYDRDKKAWRVKYAERLWRGMPRDALNARDNRAEFGNVLVQIRDFASKIGCENFAQTFDNALKTLRGEVPVGEYYAVSFAALPQPSLRAFAAVGIADVFGAMGSWDDEPPSMAQEKGLGDEYDRLSDELLAQKNLAILFAINGREGFDAESEPALCLFGRAHDNHAAYFWARPSVLRVAIKFNEISKGENLQNLEVSFEIKASKEYKNMTREISKIVYKGDRFIRIKGLCDAVLCLGWMLVVTFLCVKFWRHDIGGLLEEYGYCEVSYLPAFVWFGSPVLFFYSLALRPYLLMRTLLGKANFNEMGRKSVTLGDDFLIQRSELGEGRYYYHTISDVRDASGFVVIIIQNAMYIAIPREAFADGGAEFCAELRAKLAGLKKG